MNATASASANSLRAKINPAPCSTSVPPMKEVSINTNRLEDQAQTLLVVIGKLEETISPILSSAYPEKKCEEARETSACTLGNRLFICNERLSLAITRLVEMAERVQF